MVYQEGGVRAAARHLDIAHSSISRHLNELENNLGIPLFEKSHHGAGLILSKRGEQLARVSSESFQQIQRVVTALQNHRSHKTVTLSTTASFAARWLLPRLEELKKDLPHYDVSILIDQHLANLEDGRIDLAIRMGQGPWTGVKSRPLMDDQLYPVMSPAYWQKHHQPSQVDDLKSLTLLQDTDPNTPWSLWLDAHAPKLSQMPLGPHIASSDLLLRAALLGQGTALARHQLVKDDLESGLLIKPFGDRCIPISNAYWLVTSAHYQPRPATRAVMAWLQAQSRS